MTNIFHNLWKMWTCKHENVRCIHGDEINNTGRLRPPYIARCACKDCGKYLYWREMPDICTNTGTPHEISRGHHRAHSKEVKE